MQDKAAGLATCGGNWLAAIRARPMVRELVAARLRRSEKRSGGNATTTRLAETTADDFDGAGEVAVGRDEQCRIERSSKGVDEQFGGDISHRSSSHHVFCQTLWQRAHATGLVR